VSMPAAL